MPLCAHLKQAEETSYISKGKAQACLKTEQAPSHPKKKTAAKTGAVLISLPLNSPLSESSMRWLKLTGCLKSLPMDYIQREL